MSTVKINEYACETAPAGEDLSAWQFKLVKLNEAGELVKAGAGDVAFVLQDKPKQGQSGTYAVFGRVKAFAGAAIRPFDLLSSDAEGKAAPAATVTGEKGAVGQALSPAAEGELVAFWADTTNLNLGTAA